MITFKFCRLNCWRWIGGLVFGDVIARMFVARRHRTHTHSDESSDLWGDFFMEFALVTYFLREKRPWRERARVRIGKTLPCIWVPFWRHTNIANRILLFHSFIYMKNGVFTWERVRHMAIIWAVSILLRERDSSARARIRVFKRIYNWIFPPYKVFISSVISHFFPSKKKKYFLPS